MKNTNLLFFVTILIFLMLQLYETHVPIINSGVRTYLSISTLAYIVTLLTIDIISILFFFNFITRKNIKIDNWFNIVFLPSIMVALISIVLDVCPFFWSLYYPDALFSGQVVYKYMEDSILLVVVAKSCLIIGIIFSRERQYTMYGNIDIFKDLKIDTFKDWVANNIPLSYVVVLGVFIGMARSSFSLATRGNKAVDIGTTLLGLNVLGVLSIGIVIFVAIFYSCNNNFLPWLVVLSNSLAGITNFSRGPILLFLYYILCSSLMGKKYPKNLYILILVVLPIASLISIYLRSGSEQVVDLSFAGDSIFMLNSGLGILTNAFFLRDESSSFLPNLWNIILGLLPIPTDMLSYKTTSIAELRGTKGVGIPMPAIGDIYYQLGWLGVLIILPIAGWLLGRQTRS